MALIALCKSSRHPARMQAAEVISPVLGCHYPRLTMESYSICIYRTPWSDPRLTIPTIEHCRHLADRRQITLFDDIDSCRHGI